MQTEYDNNRMVKFFRESDIVKKAQPSSFKLSPIAAAIAVALVSQYPADVAHAGAGWGAGTDLNSNPVAIPTYYANSPAGPIIARDATGARIIDPDTKLPTKSDSGKALRKFVDTLPGIGAAKANNLGQYIPVARAEKWVDGNGTVTGDDYYEIAAVEYTEKMHSDLPKATRLRGYVQLMTPGLVANGVAAKSFTTLDGRVLSVVDMPHHLGPIINATKGTAVRIKFTNYLPVGVDMFLPVDKTRPGGSLSQNRAGMHLVGGNAPWISAGTPHQWIAPAGEVAAYAAGLGKGTSNRNVPDMVDPGPGSTTLYYPNDVSARFTFIQDATSGITRLNAYAGLESAYTITDATEQGLIASGAIPADSIPLIIEDKTFVPDNIAQQDAKWNTAVWGQPGDLWFPHVYEANQDPASIDGANPVGRWDNGRWFWPIFPTTGEIPTGEYPNATIVSESFFDTPLVNGTAYPTLTVEPRAYRFRVLNASNDRFLNLGWYLADATATRAPQLDRNGNPIYTFNNAQLYFANTEVKMVPALADAAGNPLVPAYADMNCWCQYPSLKQLNNVASSGPTRVWPLDARAGGAPDPESVGPDFIAIGNDGGFLPNPVDIPSQPVIYETNKRSITVNNIYSFGLLLGPSERADTIVDFSDYAGQTLILFNDAPAPVPSYDKRVDYYSNGPDYSDEGGAASTMPGYGPNTRTVMQVKVSANPVALTGQFNANNLKTALPTAYAASQARPIVPATAYNNAFGSNDADIYAHIATGTMAQPNLEFSSGALNITGVKLVVSGGLNQGSGTGYDPANPPTVVFNNTVNGVDCLSVGGASAIAHATVDPVTRQVSAVTLDYAGFGYVCAPTISFINPVGTSGVGAQAVIQSDSFTSIPVMSLAEQELFDTLGRYNFTGGHEMPFTGFANQDTIPLSHFDTPTEYLKDGDVQIWKIVVNGLYSNMVHFNYVDVQVLNRVGWDGTVKPPASNEVGWKDTVRINQLEDTVVAVRAKRSPVPFGLPGNKRLKDPSMPAGGPGSDLGFRVLQPIGIQANVTNDPATLAAMQAGLDYFQQLLSSPTNDVLDYDNEFAWYSSNLSHADDDFMRPIVYRPTVVVPDAPTDLADELGNGAFSWTDPTPAGDAATLANVQNEIGFKVLKAALDINGNAGAFSQIALVPANVTGWTVVPEANVVYQVVAYNAAGDSAPSQMFSEVAPVAPTGLTADPVAYNSVTLSWSPATTANRLEVKRDGVLIATLTGTATGYVDNTVTPVMTYSYEVTAANALGAATTDTITVTTPMIPLATPMIISALPNGTGTSVALRWTDNANNETHYWIDTTKDGVAQARIVIGPRSTALSTAVGGANLRNVVTVPGSVYTFAVTAVNVAGGVTSTSDAAIANVDLSAPVPLAPSNLTARPASATRATLTWLDNAGNENAYVVTRTDTTTGTVNTFTINRNAAARVATGGTVSYTTPTANPMVAGHSYSFTVVARAIRFGLNTDSAAAGPEVLDVTVPAAPLAGSVVATPGAVAGQIVVTWTDASNNESGFTVQRSLLNVAGTTWGAWGNVGTVAAGVQTRTDTGRTPGRTYRYQVRANSFVGNSLYEGPSNAVAAP